MSATSNDYAELCDLDLSRWNSRGYHPQHILSLHHHAAELWNKCDQNLKTSNCELEDISGTVVSDGMNIVKASSTTLLRGGSGCYYSTPRASYTTVERAHSPHYYYNTAGLPPKGAPHSHPGRHIYSSTNHISGIPSIFNTYTENKKKPLSPAKTIRKYGSTNLTSTPADYLYDTNKRGNGRRSPSLNRHQIYRDSVRNFSMSNIHELSTRTVTMSRDDQQDANHGFGICLKGGKEAGVGVYISRVVEGSAAERAGLRPGDVILEVNGIPFTSINHEEALKKCVQMLKSFRQISMTVRTSPPITTTTPLHGFGPPTRNPTYIGVTQTLSSSSKHALPETVSSLCSSLHTQTCSWIDRHGRPSSPPVEYGGRQRDRRERIRCVELSIEAGQSLGLMIRGGVEYGLGIFITGVDKDSVADRAGLRVGDEIIEMNGQSFLDITHDEAVNQLKYHKRMSLLIRDVGKVPHSCTSSESQPWETYNAIVTKNRIRCVVSAMVEEKARSLLPRHQFANLSYYLSEYSSRTVTIDAFVSILLEMLDTDDKHTLVTEIRELILPEDRERFDQLVYRTDRELDNIDRHREYGKKDLRSRRGSDTQIAHAAYEEDSSGYLDGIRSHLGHLTQRVKSWYWGRPLELATKLSRSFDIQEENCNLLCEKGSRRHQSMQRLSNEQNGSSTEQIQEHNPNIVPDYRGNLHITVKKTKPILGMAIEGGANTKHPLPRIINIHEHGAAYEAGGLEVGQLILEVDGHNVDGMHHQDVARLIAECFANHDKADITFLVVEAKKSNLAPKPTALVFLEA